MSKSTKEFQKPTPEEIAICAHSIYEKEGRPNGKATQHWLQAEAQLIAERKAQSEQGLYAPAKAPASTSPPAKHGDNWPGQSQGRQQQLHRN